MSKYLLLDSCISSKNLRAVTQCHAQIICNGKDYNDFVRSKLASAYASCGRMSESLHLFSFCYRRGTFLYNSIIRGFASVSHFSASLAFFRRMIDDGKSSDQHTLPSVLKACAGLSAMSLERQVHGMVIIQGYVSDVANSNALISAYGKLGDFVAADKVFGRMPLRNEITWTSLMKAFGSHCKFPEVLMLFSRMLEEGIRPDAMCFTAILSACSHGGMVEEGMQVFNSMDETYAVRPRLEHYTCVVDMLGRAGRLEEAEDIIMNMELNPDEALLRSLLGACRIHGRLDVARRVAGKVTS